MIPFNKPPTTGNEKQLTIEALTSTKTSGDGQFTKKCHEWFEANLGCEKALLTTSCTHALEMAAILLNLQAGDEVIMPSFTFVSTANAFVLRGAIPVFVDIRADNFNINEELIESAITDKTKAIVPVHYAGVACEMDRIMNIAQKHNLAVVEDAAQAFGATYKGKALGTIGDLGCFSFHETKNLSAGEGGLLIINDSKYTERAEIIREKGTNRSRFFRNQVDKYTWVDVGSSFLPSDILAAYLYAQLPICEKIKEKRKHIWSQYHSALKKYEESGKIRLPFINDFASNNAHMFYIIFDDIGTRTKFIAYMKENGVMTPFHYIPLHSSPAGEKYCKTVGEMNITERVSDCLVRLPLFYNLSDNDVAYIIDKIDEFIGNL